MNAYVARPKAAPKAGIIVFQEAFGVNHYIRGICDRFAAEGYLAIAPELFHRTGEGIEISYTDFPATAAHLQALTVEGQEADMHATHEWLSGQGVTKLTCIGFCMGGRAAFLANSILPFSACISFYGRVAPELLERVTQFSAPMLFFWGGQDTHISQSDWGKIGIAMNAAGKEQITVEMGQAGHGFFCDERVAYHEASAKIAWPLVLNFLQQN